nr:ATP-binding cassette domain-containing protein [Leucobacter sp. L43]
MLSVENVTVTYRRPGLGKLIATNDVSFELERGQVLGLVGESGCGKSTLARAICGLETPTSGRIRFDGTTVRRLKNRRRPRELMGIQMVFQNPYASLNPRRTVSSQIEDGLRAITGSARWTVAELLTEVELDRAAGEKFPHEFSGGQRQRIAIARAIAAGPELLIGDEPIASLDASLQSKIALLMRRLALESDAALLFISHDLAVVRVVADSIAVMERGRIVERGPVAEIWNDPQEPYTQKLLAAIPAVDGMGRLPG